MLSAAAARSGAPPAAGLNWSGSIAAVMVLLRVMEPVGIWARVLNGVRVGNYVGEGELFFLEKKNEKTFPLGVRCRIVPS
jgi:hypothetical protein